MNQNIPVDLLSGSVEDKHFMEIILEKTISDILSDPYTDNLMNNLSEQPVLLYPFFDGSPPCNIALAQSGIEDVLTDHRKRNYKDYNQLFLNEEVVELLDYIMENSFFNIIQETARKESDLLKLGKTFVAANK